MQANYDVVIVGAGPAGMTAAIYAYRANMSVLLLDRLAPGGQMINTNEVENFPSAGKVAGAELAMRMFTHCQDLGVEFDYRTVVNVSDEGGWKTVTCEEDDAVYRCRALILATGTVPRRLGVPGEDAWAGSGISWCAICDGSQYRGKDVVVIGGGNSAVEESLFLADICNRVTVITLFDLTADPCACERLKSRENVDIHTYQEVCAFTGESRIGGVSFRSTKDGSEKHVSCDGVFEYIGFSASSDGFASLGITDSTGCIPVDERMRTRIPGIFGAGDITVKPVRQIVTACADGAIAAQSAAAHVQSLTDGGCS